MEKTPNPLFELIKIEIENHGPMSIERYMELCLYHPTYGYYMTKDPLGIKGDFITAPEISGAFGHCLGAFMEKVLKDSSHNS